MNNDLVGGSTVFGLGVIMIGLSFLMKDPVKQLIVIFVMLIVISYPAMCGLSAIHQKVGLWWWMREMRRYYDMEEKSK